MTPTGHPPLIEVHGLAKRFAVERGLIERLAGRPRRQVAALDGVSLGLEAGETLAIVGESGCGKSTLARCLVRLHSADEGSIAYLGHDVGLMRGEELRDYRRHVQMIFQDPYSSLNPRMTVGQTLSEAIVVNGLRPRAEAPARVAELLDLVNLPPDAATRYPSEFSGGQRQRIGIARALALEPSCIIADEILSALDVSVQAQIINLLISLQKRLALSMIFVSHDLRVVRFLSHRVAVMYLGRVVEEGETEAVFSAPAHPYTRALLAAAPEVGRSRGRHDSAMTGELPSPMNLPSGCVFHPRCPLATGRCRTEVPWLLGTETGRSVACHLAPGRDPR